VEVKNKTERNSLLQVSGIYPVERYKSLAQAYNVLVFSNVRLTFRFYRKLSLY